MKTVFQIAIGYDEETKSYGALVICDSDKQVLRVDGPNTTTEERSLRETMAAVSRAIRKKAKQIKNFPLPEPSRIITPNGNGGTQLSIVTP